MTSIAVFVLALAQGHGHGDHGQDKSSRVGQEVQDFALTDNDGKVFRLGELRKSKEIAVLTFWCTTCMSCRQMEKDFEKKAKEYKDKKVRFLMVASNSTDGADQVNRFLERNELGFPVLLDTKSEVAWYFGATLTTTTAVVDSSGVLRYYGGFGKAEAAVRDLLAGKEVAVPESRSSG